MTVTPIAIMNKISRRILISAPKKPRIVMRKPYTRPVAALILADRPDLNRLTRKENTIIS